MTVIIVQRTIKVKNIVRRTNARIGRKCAAPEQGLLNLLETQATYLDSLCCSCSGQTAEKSREHGVLARMAGCPPSPPRGSFALNACRRRTSLGVGLNLA